MEIKLSCYKCGGTEFGEVKINPIIVEDSVYIHPDSNNDATVICNRCGLKDFVGGLMPNLVGEIYKDI